MDKFHQMIGRGTRVLEDELQLEGLKGEDKFLIIDCWENFEYFGENPLLLTPPQSQCLSDYSKRVEECKHQSTSLTRILL